ncbi:MAG TPA: hypothetical protein VD736_01260, partial [Nitrososphaera sp.]|nr:hypothetical protein [Nitrososphaera sp.]
MAKDAILIMSAIAAGIVVAGSLFLVYPDVTFKGTSLDTQGGASTDVPVFVDEITTAGAGSNSTNSTAGTTGQP